MCFHRQSTIAELTASVPHTFCNFSDISSSIFLSLTPNSLTHLCLKTCEISFCSAVGEQVSYKGLYKYVQWKMTISAPADKRCLRKQHKRHVPFCSGPLELSSIASPITSQTLLIHGTESADVTAQRDTILDVKFQ